MNKPSLSKDELKTLSSFLLKERIKNMSDDEKISLGNEYASIELTKEQLIKIAKAVDSV